MEEEAQSNIHFLGAMHNTPSFEHAPGFLKKPRRLLTDIMGLKSTSGEREVAIKREEVAKLLC